MATHFEPSASPTTLLGRGSTVRIVNLQSAGGQALNGKSGKLLSFDADADRWSVQVDARTTNLIKAYNLEYGERVQLLILTPEHPGWSMEAHRVSPIAGRIAGNGLGKYADGDHAVAVYVHPPSFTAAYQDTLARKLRSMSLGADYVEEMMKAIVTRCGTADSTCDTVDMAKRTTCFACGAVAPSGTTFMTCKLCVEQKLASPARYCGRACQKQHWKETHKCDHQQWQFNELAKLSLETESREAPASSLQQEAEARSEDPYFARMSVGLELLTKSDFKGAARSFRKVIKKHPLEASAFHHLGVALGRSGDDAAAGQMYAKAFELCQPDTPNWATSFASAVLNIMCSTARKPEWWSDSTLLSLSSRALACYEGEQLPAGLARSPDPFVVTSTKLPAAIDVPER